MLPVIVMLLLVVVAVGVNVFGANLSILLTFNVAVFISAMLFLIRAFTMQLLFSVNVVLTPLTVVYLFSPFEHISFIAFSLPLGHSIVTVTLLFVVSLGFALICIVPPRMLSIVTVLLSLSPLLFVAVNVYSPF